MARIMITVLSLLLAGLAACGGGGSGGTAPDPAPTPPPTSQSAAGIWRGSLCIVDEPLDIPGHDADGQSGFSCLFDGPTARGYFVVTDGDLSGLGTLYNAGEISDGPVTGTLVGDQLTVSLEGHEFSMVYDPIYETVDVTLEELSGVYTLVTVSARDRNSSGSERETSGLVIDPDGHYFLQDGDGCVFEGFFTKGEQNLYSVSRVGSSASSDNCPIPPSSYEGLAFMDDTRLVIALFSPNGWMAITAE